MTTYAGIPTSEYARLCRNLCPCLLIMKDKNEEFWCEPKNIRELDEMEAHRIDGGEYKFTSDKPFIGIFTGTHKDHLRCLVLIPKENWNTEESLYWRRYAQEAGRIMRAWYCTADQKIGQRKV